jgi:hypothetical protein
MHGTGRTSIMNWFKKRKAKEDPDTKMIDIKKILNLNSNTPDLVGNVTIKTMTPSILYGPNHPSTSHVVSSVGSALMGAANIVNVSTINATAAVGHGVYTSGTGQFTFQQQQPPNILTIMDRSNKELVRITKEGEVIWADGFQVTEAAEVFSHTLHLSTELAAGVRYAVKQKIRDVIFQEMIDMAKEKGVLTADELTYLWQAAKIMDKLKGIT